MSQSVNVIVDLFTKEMPDMSVETAYCDTEFYSVRKYPSGLGVSRKCVILGSIFKCAWQCEDRLAELDRPDVVGHADNAIVQLETLMVY